MDKKNRAGTTRAEFEREARPESRGSPRAWWARHDQPGEYAEVPPAPLEEVYFVPGLTARQFYAALRRSGAGSRSHPVAALCQYEEDWSEDVSADVQHALALVRRRGDKSSFPLRAVGMCASFFDGEELRIRLLCAPRCGALVMCGVLRWARLLRGTTSVSAQVVPELVRAYRSYGFVEDDGGDPGSSYVKMVMNMDGGDDAGGAQLWRVVVRQQPGAPCSVEENGVPDARSLLSALDLLDDDHDEEGGAPPSSSQPRRAAGSKRQRTTTTNLTDVLDAPLRLPAGLQVEIEVFGSDRQRVCHAYYETSAAAPEVGVIHYGPQGEWFRDPATVEETKEELRGADVHQVMFELQDAQYVLRDATKRLEDLKRFSFKADMNRGARPEVWTADPQRFPAPGVLDDFYRRVIAINAAIGGVAVTLRELQAWHLPPARVLLKRH